MQHLGLADSIGVDFHKTGFAPYVSSLFLVRDKADLALISRSAAAMPYLFKSGDYHPGQFTLETSRAGTGVLAGRCATRCPVVTLIAMGAAST